MRLFFEFLLLSVALSTPKCPDGLVDCLKFCHTYVIKTGANEAEYDQCAERCGLNCKGTTKPNIHDPLGSPNASRRGVADSRRRLQEQDPRSVGAKNQCFVNQAYELWNDLTGRMDEIEERYSNLHLIVNDKHRPTEEPTPMPTFDPTDPTYTPTVEPTKSPLNEHDALYTNSGYTFYKVKVGEDPGMLSNGKKKNWQQAKYTGYIDRYDLQDLCSRDMKMIAACGEKGSDKNFVSGTLDAGCADRTGCRPKDTDCVSSVGLTDSLCSPYHGDMDPNGTCYRAKDSTGKKCKIGGNCTVAGHDSNNKLWEEMKTKNNMIGCRRRMYGNWGGMDTCHQRALDGTIVWNRHAENNDGNPNHQGGCAYKNNYACMHLNDGSGGAPGPRYDDGYQWWAICVQKA